MQIKKNALTIGLVLMGIGATLFLLATSIDISLASPSPSWIAGAGLIAVAVGSAFYFYDFFAELLGKPSWAKAFPRLYELYGASSQGGPYNYFEHPSVKKALLEKPPDSQMLEVEHDLQRLDPVAWKEFKSKAVNYVVAQDKWGWPRQLFDSLNEAKGYGYLKELGCTDIHFLKERDKKGEETPDLLGKREQGLVLLEVKTVHESEDNDDYLTNRGEYRFEKAARRVKDSISDAMKKKLQSKIDKATKQLFSQNLNLPQPIIRRIIFLVVWLDMDCATHLIEEELAQFLSQICPQSCELVHCVANRIFVA